MPLGYVERMDRPRPSRRATLLVVTLAAAFALVAACSSDSSGSGGSDGEVTIVTTPVNCDRVIAEVEERLSGFDTTVDTGDLQQIEAEVNAGTDALGAAGCEDSYFGELSQTRCDALLAAESADPAAESVLTGFQENCAEG